MIDDRFFAQLKIYVHIQETAVRLSVSCWTKSLKMSSLNMSGMIYSNC